MATSPTYVDPRTGEEKEHPNAENIRAAIKAKETKQKLIQVKSDLQRRINYRQYNETSNHVVRPKSVRQAVSLLLTLSEADRAETLQLIDELTQ